MSDSFFYRKLHLSRNLTNRN